MSPSLVTIIRRQSWRFELRLSQTSVFLDFLKAVLDERSSDTCKNIKIHFWQGNPQKDTKLLVLELRPGLHCVIFISDHNIRRQSYHFELRIS